MVIDKIGIEKIHTPTLALRRETTEKKHPASLGQERPERMVLHVLVGLLYVIEMEI